MKNVYLFTFFYFLLINSVWAAGVGVMHSDIIWSKSPAGWDAACSQLPRLMNEASNKTCSIFGGKISGPFPIGPVMREKDTEFRTGRILSFKCTQKIQFYCNR